jgi:hypothetical protein
VGLERVELRDERVFASLTETHRAADFKTPQIACVWRFEFETLPDIHFEVQEPYRYGHERHDPNVVFGWRLAEATGWSKPN